MKNTIGERISVLRKLNNLSQKELAEKLNVSNKTISKWECDNGEPDLNALKQLSEVFNTSIDYLLNGKLNDNTKNTHLKGAENLRVSGVPKKVKYIVLSSFLIILSLAVFLTCFFTIPRQPNINSNELVVNNEVNTINLTVANEKNNYSFIDKFSIPITNTWRLYSDLDCKNEIVSQTVSLEEGDNVFYILVMNNKKAKKIYTVTIRRKPIYKITIDTSGGSPAKHILEVEEGENFDIADIPIPVKDGYTFKKWSGYNNPIMSDTYIKAEWGINDYKVTLNHNGGNYSIDSVDVVYNSYLPNQKSIPQKLGYTFNGYFSRKNEMYYNANMVGVKQYRETGDIELIAKYTIINYNISYVLNGGVNSSYNKKTYNVEMNNFELFEPKKTAYDFINWTIDGKPISIINTKDCKNLVVTANFTPTVYTITYILNNGTNSENNPATYTIETPTINLTPATFENEKVSRWYLENTFENRVTKISKGSYGNKVFYAKSGYNEFDVFTIDSNTIISLNMDFISEFNIADIEVPYGITSIQQNAFLNKTTIKSLSIPITVSTLQKGLLEGCSGLESIILPFVGERLKEPSDLYQYPFGYIFGENEYSGSVESVQNYFADNISYLTTTSYYIPNKLKSVSIIHGYINKYAFNNCINIQNITLLDGVTGIGADAFYNCHSLVSAVFPNSLINIERDIFRGCSSLESITLPFIGDSRKGPTDTYQYPLGYLFGGLSYENSMQTIQYYYGENIVSPTHDYYYIPKTLRNLVVTDGQINDHAFENCNTLKNVVIKSLISKIGNYAFFNCTSLENVDLPSSLTIIGQHAFSMCTVLVNIEIPKNVDTIGEMAFSETAIVEIVIPDKVTVIEGYTFYGCKNLEKIFLNNVRTIGKSCFRDCTKLNLLLLPSCVTFVDENAVINCVLLEIYYESNESNIDWDTNWNPDDRPVYLYSETQPTETGNYWHYVDGVVTKW